MKISKKQKIYAIVILCILIILPVTYAVIFPFSNRNILYIATIPCLVTWALAPWLLDKEDGELKAESNRKAVTLKDVLRKKEYFTRKIWKRKYSEYLNKHPLENHRLKAASMTADLSWQYMKKLLRNYFLVSALTIPAGFVLWLVYISDYIKPERSSTEESCGIILTIAAENLVFFALLYLISRHVFKKWISGHPDASIIQNSYADGYAFTNSYYSLVIGSKYIHGFDGEEFFSVPKNDIRKVKCRIELMGANAFQTEIENQIADIRTQINRKGKSESEFAYKRESEESKFQSELPTSVIMPNTGRRTEYDDRYMFNINLITHYNSIDVVLDQFQIKMIMDNFFPDISDCLNVEYACSGESFVLLPPSGSSDPILGEDR